MFVRVRSMTLDDLALVLRWAGDEGWNPGVGDAPFFIAPDPSGLLVAEVGGEVVGSIGMPRFGAGYAFAGLYIVRPDHRGGPVGARLGLAALRHAGDRMVGTDGVLERVADYEALGFVAVHAHHRHSGTPRPAVHPRVRPPLPGDIDALVAIDDACFPGDRQSFMRAWLGGDHVVRVWVGDAGAVSGFGVARQAVDGWRVGPLLAPHAEAAEAIMRDLAAAVPKQALHLDVNTGNPDAVNMARDVGLSPGFECVRMYRGGMPGLPLSRMWGACTLELG